MTPLQSIGFAAFLLGATTACGSSVEGDHVVPSTIEFYGDEAQLAAPAEVTAGEPFTVSITTYSGGCKSKHHTEVDTGGLQVDIRPFDEDRSDPDKECISMLTFDDHSVEVTLDEVGEATVVVHGLFVDADIEEERTWTLPVTVAP